MDKPTWRQIEAALIDLLLAEGFHLEWDKGNTFIFNSRKSVCIADLARQLEDRLNGPL